MNTLTKSNAKPEPAPASIFLGIDCGATTSKVCAVDAQGTPLSLELRQRPTRGQEGATAILAGWMEGVEAFLTEHSLGWDSVGGVGLAIPGPYLDYGVLGKMPNLPAELEGWHFLDDLAEAIANRAKRHIPVATANDGQLAGVAEATRIQREQPGSVLMLSPGSGLGCAFVHADGRGLAGDHSAAVIFCHMPAPFHLLDLPRFTCGCGRDWGCFEAYTSISGLPQMLAHFLPRYPGHPLATDNRPDRQKVLSLRGLAQEGDPLALHIFDTQAAALGLTVAAAAMAYDPSHIVIGGGLIDPESTTPAFRERYLQGIRRSAARWLWVSEDKLSYHQAAYGELSQAIGAACLVS